VGLFYVLVCCGEDQVYSSDLTQYNFMPLMHLHIGQISNILFQDMLNLLIIS